MNNECYVNFVILFISLNKRLCLPNMSPMSKSSAKLQNMPEKN